MKKPNKSEKILLQQIFQVNKGLLECQRGLEIGQLITLVRTQLKMSQRMLAKRSKIEQSTISRIESQRLEPNISTLKRILDAMSCDLLITILPRQDLEAIKQKQAQFKAEQKIHYLHGTMSLEKQEPSKKLLNELISDEIKSQLDSSHLWES